jgi:hypothetical protein
LDWEASDTTAGGGGAALAQSSKSYHPASFFNHSSMDSIWPGKKCALPRPKGGAAPGATQHHRAACDDGSRKLKLAMAASRNKWPQAGRLGLQPRVHQGLVTGHGVLQRVTVSPLRPGTAASGCRGPTGWAGGGLRVKSKAPSRCGARQGLAAHSRPRMAASRRSQGTLVNRISRSIFYIPLADRPSTGYLWREAAQTHQPTCT